MAQFRGRIITNRGQVSRLGHKSTGLTLEANGWNSGVRIEAFNDGDGDRFEVYATGGSNDNAGPFRLGVVRLVDGKLSFQHRGWDRDDA